MLKRSRPTVYFDINVLIWGAGFETKDRPNHFDPGIEREAIEDLLQMRERGEIQVVVSQEDFNRRVKAMAKDPSIMNAVREHFNGRLLFKEILLVVGSETKCASESVERIVRGSKERQDDPAQFSRIEIEDISVTHFATLDSRFLNKYQQYRDKLQKDSKLRQYRDTRKGGGKEILEGRPSDILAMLLEDKDS